MSKRVHAHTSSYIDDIIINTDHVSVDEVRQHLKYYGLVCKDPEPLIGSAVLGLKVSQSSKGLIWKRKNGDLIPRSDSPALDRHTNQT